MVYDVTSFVRPRRSALRRSVPFHPPSPRPLAAGPRLGVALLAPTPPVPFSASPQESFEGAKSALTAPAKV